MSDIQPHIAGSPGAILGAIGRFFGGLLLRLLKIRLLWVTTIGFLVLYYGVGAFATYVAPDMVGVKR